MHMFARYWHLSPGQYRKVQEKAAGRITELVNSTPEEILDNWDTEACFGSESDTRIENETLRMDAEAFDWYLHAQGCRVPNRVVIPDSKALARKGAKAAAAVAAKKVTPAGAMTRSQPCLPSTSSTADSRTRERAMPSGRA